MMTTPALERAARAAYDGYGFKPRDDMGGDLKFEQLAGFQQDNWRNVARAVLMAVLPSEKDADDAPEWMDPAQAYGWGCGFNACRDAILGEGEGE